MFKNLKLYSVAQKIKWVSSAWSWRSHAIWLLPAYSSAFPFALFHTFLSCLLGFLIFGWYYLCGVYIRWNLFLFKFYSLLSFHLSCHPIQKPSPLAAAFFHPSLLFIYSCIHNHTTNIYCIPSMLKVLSFPKREFLFHV